MAASPTIVLNGVVVSERPTALPGGTEAQIVVTPIPFTFEEQAESDAWDKLSDEGWSQIDWGEGEIARDSG